MHTPIAPPQVERVMNQIEPDLEAARRYEMLFFVVFAHTPAPTNHNGIQIALPSLCTLIVPHSSRRQQQQRQTQRQMHERSQEEPGRDLGGSVLPGIQVYHVPPRQTRFSILHSWQDVNTVTLCWNDDDNDR